MVSGEVSLSSQTEAEAILTFSSKVKPRVLYPHISHFIVRSREERELQN